MKLKVLKFFQQRKPDSFKVKGTQLKNVVNTVLKVELMLSML